MLEPSGKTPTVALSREVTGAGVEVLVLAEEAFEDAYEVEDEADAGETKCGSQEGVTAGCHLI